MWGDLSGPFVREPWGQCFYLGFSFWMAKCPEFSSDLCRGQRSGASVVEAELGRRT